MRAWNNCVKRGFLPICERAKKKIKKIGKCRIWTARQTVGTEENYIPTAKTTNNHNNSTMHMARFWACRLHNERGNLMWTRRGTGRWPMELEQAYTVTQQLQNADRVVLDNSHCNVHCMGACCVRRSRGSPVVVGVLTRILTPSCLYIINMGNEGRARDSPPCPAPSTRQPISHV
jgi:hypothetical protein